ncbi:MAG: acetyl-coenzyme A synthetase N-terminal domain-containing protein, partial [Steroidobacteraceae bacterium]
MQFPTHSVPEDFAASAVVKAADYQRMLEQAASDPEAYWTGIARRLDWMRFPTRIKDVSYALENFHIRWYEDGELNVTVNCLDRHLATRADKTALLFEGDEPGHSRAISYRELHERTCQLANGLRELGIG